jgi:hypothetical protein
LKLIFSLNGFIGHGQDDIDTITAKVNAFKSHPTVISWYMNDELGLEYLSELEAQYQKVRELDNDHPVWSVHWRKYVLVEEAHTTDILGVDPYPIPAHPITMVSDWADWAEEAGRGYRPLWIVPQIFNWSDYGRAGRPPTREEMRAMTYLAVNHGAKGLIYYSYFNIRDDADYDTRWPQIKGIANEINQLRPVFLSIEQTNNNDIVCDNEDIDFNLMRHNNAYYLFAVNTLNVNITGVSFQINLTNQPEAIETLFEGGRTVPVTDGNFTDDFGSYEVHVYVVNQCTDEDGDMYYSEAGCGPEVDCNDFDSSINPGACDVKGDGIDQDCDGQDRTRGRPCTAGGDDGGEPDGIEGRGKTCSDSIDNDSDGLIDCDDPDCFKKKSCR